MRFLLIVICLLLPSAAASQPFGYSLASGDLNRFELPDGVIVDNRSLAQPTDSVAMTQLAGGELLSLDSVGDLWRIDALTGSTTRIGASGIVVGQGAGLTQDACGTLWIANDTGLYRADPATGAATFVASLSRRVSALTSRGTSLFALTEDSQTRLSRIDPVTGELTALGDDMPAGRTQGLDFDADGRLWAVSAASPPFGFHFVTEIDPDTGTALQSRQLPVGSGVFGGNLAVSSPQGACVSPAEVPLSPVVLWSLAAALAVVGARRRRAAGTSP